MYLKDYLLGPVLMLIIGLLYYFFPPKGINSVYGYRTPAAMKNERNWELSNKWASQLFLVLVMVLFLFCYLNYRNKYMGTADFFLLVFLIGMGTIIAIVEFKLWKLRKEK